VVDYGRTEVASEGRRYAIPFRKGNLASHRWVSVPTPIQTPALDAPAAEREGRGSQSHVVGLFRRNKAVSKQCKQELPEFPAESSHAICGIWTIVVAK
jgi:hypothetical protein